MRAKGGGAPTDARQVERAVEKKTSVGRHGAARRPIKNSRAAPPAGSGACALVGRGPVARHRWRQRRQCCTHGARR